jgi:hypothetical protein
VTPEEIAGIEEALKAATPGPFFHGCDQLFAGDKHDGENARLLAWFEFIPPEDEDGDREANMRAIVLLHRHAPALLAAAKEAQALRDVAEKARAASRLRLFVATYDGRVLDQPRGLAILDALDAALARLGGDPGGRA